MIFPGRFNNQKYANVKNHELHALLSKDEQLMVDFIKQCLAIDPKLRLQAEEALRHDWFRELLIQTEREIDSKLLLRAPPAKQLPEISPAKSLPIGEAAKQTMDESSITLANHQSCMEENIPSSDKKQKNGIEAASNF
jgi:serine/threonine protein kinase